MYESHFGFSGSPFQLNPDPAFYFDSRGHSNALAYLKFGAHQGEGFIVVTGEIGAGKTTLVRTLLEGLNPDHVVAAQVVSTQLESSELLQAILMAFGIPSLNTSKAHLIANLEGFLTALAAKGRRALLIIDEAQNLKHEAVEELRMLSNFQLGKYGLLQSFLVGQPELRVLLQSKSMEQLRQRVIASCHLGPLDASETQAYIEHRLRRVGWNGASPAFASGAFDRVHYWTGGVPRKINRLCNRMLLGAFLTNASVVSLAMVDETASELRDEIGEAVLNVAPPAVTQPAVAAIEESTIVHAAGPESRSPAAPPSGASAAATTKALLDVRPPLASERDSTSVEASGSADSTGTTVRSDTAVVGEVAAESEINLTARPQHSKPTRTVHRPRAHARFLVCLVDSTADYLKAGTLQEVFQGFPSLPDVMAVHWGSESDIWSPDLAEYNLSLPSMGLHLDLPRTAFASRTAGALDAFEEVLDELDPCAVLVMGDSDEDLACALLANKRGYPLLRIGSGQRGANKGPSAQINSVLIERLADIHYTYSTETFYALYREGIRLDRVKSVGNLTKEMLDETMVRMQTHQPNMQLSGNEIGELGISTAFGVVTIDLDHCRVETPVLTQLLALLCVIAGELPLIWPLRAESYERITQSEQGPMLKAARVIIVRRTDYLQSIAILQNAKCVIATDEGDLLDEAASLHIPTMLVTRDLTRWSGDDAASEFDGIAITESAPPRLHRILSHDATAPEPPEYWDTGTAARIANHLITWLPKGSPVQDRLPDRETATAQN